LPFPDESAINAGVERRGETAAAGAAQPRIEAAEIERTCPRCGQRLAERACKLICARCGYCLSCSDF
jgi:Zn finger protein HypA/HybF involved in hydrogenase expression